MATTINNTYTKTSSGYPYMQIVISNVKETGRANGTANFSASVVLNINGYAKYTATGRFYIGETAVGDTITLPSTSSDPSYGKYHQVASATLKFSASGLSNAGGTISNISFRMSSSLSNYTYNTGSKSLDYSKFNTAPVTGSMTAPGTTTVSEKTTSISVGWNAATDAENNVKEYVVQYQKNGGTWTGLVTTASRTYSHSISAAEGQTYRYRHYARDTYGLEAASWQYSGTVTTNTFSAAGLSSSAKITYSANNINVAFTRTNASNTQSGVTTSYKITSNDITVYNQTSGINTSFNLIVWNGTGTAPTTVYIKASDIKTKFKSASYQGNLTFVLTSTNSNGTAKTSSKTIAVDFRTNPNPATSLSVGTTTSTAYKLGAYYLPQSSSEYIRLSWTAPTQILETTFTYDVQVSLDNGASYSTKSTGQTGTTYNWAPGVQTSAKTAKFRIIAKAAYGNTATATYGSNFTIHYWSKPSISVGSQSRTDSTATVPITIKANTSIGSGVKGSWTCTNGQNGTFSNTTSAQNVNLTGLTGSGTYTINVSYNDTTNMQTTNQTQAVGVGANVSVFNITKYGIGVGGTTADADSRIKVAGAILPKGAYSGTTAYNAMPAGFSVVDVGEPNAGFGSTYSTTITAGTGANRQFQLNVNNTGSYFGVRSGHVNNTDGTGTGWSKWRKIVLDSEAFSRLYVGTSNTYIGQGNDNTFKINNNYGYLQMGPQNTSHCHFRTDRPNFWFEKDVRIQGNLYVGSSYNTPVMTTSGGTFTGAITANGGITLPNNTPITWVASGDKAQIRAVTGSDGRTYVDAVVGDDDNDAFRVVNDKWDDGAKTIFQVNRTDSWFNSPVLPWSTNTFDLGGTNYRWSGVYGRSFFALNSSNQFVAQRAADTNATGLYLRDTSNSSRVQFYCPNQNNNAHVYSTANVILRGGYVGCRTTADDAYVECRASKFTVNSEEKWKTNILELDTSALDKINQTTIYSYDKTQGDANTSEIGLIIDRGVPEELITYGEYRDDRTEEEKAEAPALLDLLEDEQEGDRFIDLYAMTSMAWKAIQELSEQNKRLQAKVEELTSQLK